MQEHLPPTQGARGSSEPLVRHVTQAHPNDLVDPWWMDQALSRDYSEFIYRQWVVDVEDVEPEVVDRSLTDDVRLLRRGTLLNARRIQCVVEGDDAVACIQLGRRSMWAGVAGRDLKRAQHLLDELGRSFPDATRDEDEEPHIVLGIWGLQDESRGFRRLEVAPWSDIASNYATTTRESLAPVMDPGFSLEDTGELFGSDARRQTGQGLARLLNATDGMLAQGSKTAFVITTNEPIDRFHEAVIRPGRCASRVSFEALPFDQAKAWLQEHDAAEVAKRLRTPATLAELYAMAARQLEPPSAPATGLYL